MFIMGYFYDVLYNAADLFYDYAVTYSTDRIDKLVSCEDEDDVATVIDDYCNSDSGADDLAKAVFESITDDDDAWAILARYASSTEILNNVVNGAEINISFKNDVIDKTKEMIMLNLDELKAETKYYKE